MTSVTPVRQAVTASFEQAAARHRRVLRPLDDALILADCGLDSLCMVDVVEHLESELGVDPVAELDAASFPRRFGEFVQLYEAAAQGVGAAGR
jgi:hypothetical protein